MALTAPVRSLAVAALLGLLLTPRLTNGDAAQVAHAAGGNSGDTKISDSTQPPSGTQANEPHVQCQFYVLGFNFAAPAGVIRVVTFPPTGDGTTVLTVNYVGTPTDSGTFQFTSGPYTLPAGHYKVYVTDNKGASIAKQKVFWIDGCPATPTPIAPTATSVPTATATSIASIPGSSF